MVNEMMGWSWAFSTMTYGDSWRERRRLFTKYFHPNSLTANIPQQREFTHKMLVQLLDNPDDFLGITRRCARILADVSVNLPVFNRTFGGLSLTLAYGLPIRKQDDPYLAIAEEAVRTVSAALVPGAFLVDFMPFLKYIPEWVPGAGFQTTAKKYFEIQGRFRNDPFDHAVKNIVSIASPDSSFQI